MNDKATIYALTEPDGEIPRYIGVTTKDPRERYLAHLWPCSLRVSTHKNNWVKFLLKQGKKPGMEILATVDAENADIVECAYIAAFKMMGFRLTNGTPGGNGRQKGWAPSEETRRKISESLTGFKHTETTRQNMSKAHKGQPNAMKGRKHTKETRRKISEAHKGRKLSEETRRKMSESGRCRIPITEATRLKLSKANKGNKSALGHNHTEKARQKMSDAQKGEKNSGAKMTAVLVIEARELYATGKWIQRALAVRFGASQQLIWTIIHRKSWRHVL